MRSKERKRPHEVDQDWEAETYMGITKTKATSAEDDAMNQSGHRMERERVQSEQAADSA